MPSRDDDEARPRKRRRDDDSDEYPRPRKKAGSSAPLWIIAAVLGAAFLACGGATLLVFVGCGKTMNEMESQTKAKTAKAYPREELRKLLVGKTTDEVLKLLGPPDRTGEIGRSKTWDYREITKDPINNRLDLETTLWIGPDGTVDRITF